ncbi:MAG TPA: hypothetical protein VGK73_08725 [Polyangiaceae bacterium]
MATLVPAPEYPIPGQDVAISFTGLDADTNQLQVNATMAPIGSELRKRIDAARGEVVDVYSGSTTDPWRFKPDKGGVYTFELLEFQVQPSSGALFAGDPAGAPRPALQAKTTVLLYVGERLSLKMGEAPNQLDLVVFVWNNTVRATSVPVHGVATPALENPTSPAAASAKYDATLLLLVEAMGGTTTSSILGTFATDFANLKTSWNAHLADATAHNNADTLRTIGSGWSAATTKGAPAAINELRRLMVAHMGSLTIPAANPVDPPVPIHDAIDGTTVFQSAGCQEGRASQYFALADAVVRLAEHKAIGAPVHNSADAAAAPTIGPLTTIMARYITALRLTSPTLPPARNPGAATLEQFGGFSA